MVIRCSSTNNALTDILISFGKSSGLVDRDVDVKGRTVTCFDKGLHVMHVIQYVNMYIQAQHRKQLRQSIARKQMKM